MKKTRLLIQPLPERGIMLRICTGGVPTWIRETHVAHGEDIVIALDTLLRAFPSVAEVSVVCGIGSFSASRSAFVAATVLGATRGVPVRLVRGMIHTPEDLAHTTASRARGSLYERSPHITKPS